MREGWEVTILGEIVEIAGGSAIPPNNEAYVGLEHFDPGERWVKRFGSTSQVTSASTPFRPGDILFSKLRPYLNKVSMVDQRGWCSNEALVYRAIPEKVSQGYLFNILRSQQAIAFATQSSAGTRMPRTSSKKMDSYPVGLPPLREQKRIVDLMDSVDAAISAAQAEVDTAVALETRINLEVFRPLLDGATAQVSTRTDMKLGRQKGGAAATDVPKYATVKSGSITSTHLVNPASFDEMPIPEAWIASHGLRPGDVVLAEGGTVGESAVWPDHLVGDYGYDKHVIRIRPLEGKSTTNFIAHWCRFMKASGTFDATATGKTISALGFGRAAKLPFPDLSVTEQEDVVRPLVAADSAVSTSQSALDRLRDLRSSMLSVLLSGEHEIPETYDQFLGLPERAQAG
nr:MULTISPECIES: restriction endonuclease subunit S [unclassified Dietzia]